MNPKKQLFRGCNANAINLQLYESFKEALAVDNIDSLIHKKDIKFMKSACDLYDSNKSRSTLRDLVSKVSGHVNIVD